MQRQPAVIYLGGFPEGSDAVLHWGVLPPFTLAQDASNPKEDRLRCFRKKTTRMASPKVLCLTLLHCHIKEIVEMTSFCPDVNDDSARVATAGHWFEALSHLSLAAGGTFMCRMIGQVPGTAEFTLTLPQCSAVQHYSSAQELFQICEANLQTYCILRLLRASAIDSASSAAAWFHVR